MQEEKAARDLANRTAIANQLREMFEDGKTWAEVRELTGMSRSWLAHTARLYGLRPKPAPGQNVRWASAEEADMRDMLSQGKHWDHIAEALGRTREGCQQRAKKLGLRLRPAPGKIAAPELGHVAPHHKPKGLHPMKCLCCGRDFMSWDRARNRKCKPDCERVDA